MAFLAIKFTKYYLFCPSCFAESQRHSFNRSFNLGRADRLKPYLICTVFLEGKKYFLDATEKFGDLGNYYPRIAGQQVLIEDGNTFILETIPNASSEENKETLTFTYHLEGENCKGSGAFSYYGDEKTSLLYFLASIASKDHEKKLTTRFTRKNDNVNLQLLSLPDFSKRDTVLHFEVTSELKNQVIDLGDEMYINLETQFYLKGLEMEEERNIPYRFTSKSLSEITTTFQTPEGWEVNYIPETLDFNTPNYHFHFSYKVQDTQIKYQTSFEIKNLFLQPNDFENWNKMIQSIEDFYANPIILTKK